MLRQNNDTSLDIQKLSLANHEIHILRDVSQRTSHSIILQSLKFSPFKTFHGFAQSHSGQQCSINIIFRVAVWRGMRKDIARWTRERQECVRAKGHRHNKAPLQTVKPSLGESFS